MLRMRLNTAAMICGIFVSAPSIAQVLPETADLERALLGLETGLAVGEHQLGLLAPTVSSLEASLLLAAPMLETTHLSLGTMVPSVSGLETSLLAVAPALAAAEHSLLTLSPNIGLMGFAAGSRAFVNRHTDDWFPQDTADAVYRRARAAMNEGEFRRAVDLFRRVRTQYAQSRYVPQSMYYEALSLYRMENERSYRTALGILDDYRSRFPNGQISDAEALYVRIQGQLARRGDSEAAAAVAERAAQLAPVVGVPVNLGLTIPLTQSGDDDVRMQALNALMQMDAESAMPILRDVLANHAADRVHLRRRAVFLVAQKRTDGREEILLDAARHDPDLGVREQAVQFLAQVRTDAAVSALDSILQTSSERSLQQRAIMALSQHRSERSADILREYALRADADVELRSYAIQWLGQRRGNTPFLRDLYGRLDDRGLKERTLFALSQRRSEDNAQFLLDIAMDETESMETRKRALFWLGQMRRVSADIYGLYERVDDLEMKEQLIAAYGQRRSDSLAVDKLISVARDEPNTRLRNRAIFWLGQTRDPRAIEVLREIINR